MNKKHLVFVLFILVLILACSDKGSNPVKPSPPPSQPGDFVEGWANWSPDGRYIFYTRPSRDTLEEPRFGHISIWAYDTQTNHYGFYLGPGEFPKWNPTGTILAFEAGNNVYFYYPDTKSFRQVSRGIAVYVFSWSYDGSELLLGDSGIIIDTLGNVIRGGTIIQNGFYVNLAEGDWSRFPDSILVPVHDVYGYFAIIITDSLCNLIQVIARAETIDDWFENIAWSPDGNRIAADYFHPYNVPPDNFMSIDDLRIYRSDGRFDRIIADIAGNGAWSPDGSMIAFQKYTWMAHSRDPGIEPDSARVTVWICNADGSDMHELLGWPQVGYDSTMFDGGYNWITNTWGP